jgi:hypothetical protein
MVAVFLPYNMAMSIKNPNENLFQEMSSISQQGGPAK